MFHKYLGFNKCTIGFVTLICIVFAAKYLEIVNLRNSLIILDDNNAEEEYGDMELNINALKSNTKRLLEIKQMVKRNNEIHRDYNICHFKVHRQASTIIVIEVRSNPFYLQSLIESLKKVVGIKNSLLVFSHDVFDEDMNEIVKSVSFAKYIQIYYPYSVQLHPNIFPGGDSKFCIYDFNCVHNDGQRNATVAQMKHHWWWTSSFVFDHLKVTRDFNGTVIFLEEDQGVAADIIYVLKMLERLRPNSCPHCEILSLGAFKPIIKQYHPENASMVISTLGSTPESLGIAFNKALWNNVKRLSEHFCNFNDSSWMRSLVHTASKSHEGKFYMLLIEGPRVFRFDQCPYEDVQCGELDKVDAVQSFTKKIKRSLFPTVMTVRVDNTSINMSKGRGGWDDARDHELCQYITRKSRSE